MVREGRRDKNYFLCSGEMLNYNLNARRGFFPRRCGSPDAILPNRCYAIIAKRRGGRGGTGTVPFFIRTRILNLINLKGITMKNPRLFIMFA